CCLCFFFFFFSSRRRHTRWPRDWSSDVCSSDLAQTQITAGLSLFKPHPLRYPGASHLTSLVRIDRGKSRIYIGNAAVPSLDIVRSEERRVGKEWRTRSGPGDGREKVRRK